MRNFIKPLSVVFVVFANVAACSSGGGSPQDAGGDVTPTDSGKKPLDASNGDASDAATCTAASTYGTTVTDQTAVFTPTPADAGADAGPEDFYVYDGSLNTDIDFIDLELYDGYGVFSGGIAPGTYNLSGAELQYADCGLCALILTDGSAPDSTTDAYMATGGSITITTVTPTLAGTLTNVTFTHVSIDSNSGQSSPVADGCKSSIPSLAFSATVTQ